MIEESVKVEILKRIQSVEQEHSVKVLYAVESGSRAWGFASPNSDYDVRFIYTHPKDWYVSIDLEDKRDVIEYPIVDEIDINGWDVRKALKLLWKSNPSIIEWLHSPIVYLDNGSFAKKACGLLKHIYSTDKGIYHYRSMANTNYRGYLKGNSVPLKKYFYVLRPLLAIKWLEEYHEPAPIEFDKLRSLVSDHKSLNSKIEELLERKKLSLEKEMVAPYKELNQFIEQELNRLEAYRPTPYENDREISKLNELFHEVLNSLKD